MVRHTKLAVAAAAVVQVGVFGLAAGTGTPTPAGAAGSPGSACPAAYPVGAIRAGLTGTGLTVSSGTTPAPFTATVLGVLKDGIAPGVDMILVKTDSPAIREAGGIWAGMSGSPVYAPDGRLLGAVAYGLAASSPIGGLTPAAAMQKVAAMPAAATKARVVLPTALQHRLVAASAASSAEAVAGMTQLPVPLSVSGLSAGRADSLAQRLGKRTKTTLVPYTGSAGSGKAAPAAAIVPGGNFAAAVSYGDLTVAGVGTATTVCGNTVLAFGHPLLLAGKTALSAQAADTIYVQDDPLNGPFKVANLTGTVGTLTQDRLTAIAATLGRGPAVIPVTIRTSAADGLTRVGTTRVAVASLLPDIAAFHVMSNLDATLQKAGEGRAVVTWTITGRTSAGAFTLTRTTRLADQYDLDSAVANDLYAQLGALSTNRYAAVTFTGVTGRIDAAEQYRGYTVDRLLVRKGTRWVGLGAVPTVNARPGARLTIRAVLAPYQERGHVRSVDVTVTVPKTYAGQTGQLEVTGGASAAPTDLTTAHSFTQLLGLLRTQPRPDTLLGTLGFTTDTGTTRVVARRNTVLDQVVNGDTTVTVVVARK